MGLYPVNMAAVHVTPAAALPGDLDVRYKLGVLIREYVSQMAHGRQDIWWGRRVEQVLDVLHVAAQGATCITSAKLRREGWGAEAEVAELAGALAFAALRATGNGPARQEAAVLGRKLSAMGHRGLAEAVWRTARRV